MKLKLIMRLVQHVSLFIYLFIYLLGYLGRTFRAIGGLIVSAVKKVEYKDVQD